LIACKEIGEGKLHVPELLGDINIDPISTEGAYDTKLDSKRVQNKQVLQLLQRYTQRTSAFSPN
jgi:glutamate--cysteine ligase catalytic subunit